MFWSFAGVFVAFVAIALACVLLPWRRAGGRWRALGWPAALLLLLMPPMTGLLYRALGAPAMLDLPPVSSGERHDADAMLKALERRLEKQPDDAEAWYVLGQAYLALERTRDAEAALARAVTLAPKAARYLSHYAEVLALADRGDLQKRARALVEAALELDPQEEKALELAGLAAYQREEWTQAAYYWRRLLKRLPPGSEFRQDIEAALKQARGKAEQATAFGGQAGAMP